MAEDATSFLLRTLQNQMAAHFHLISGAENELNHLLNDVRLMKASLKESVAQSSRGETSKEYERQVRDVVHEAEDIVDECLTRAALEKSRTLRNRFVSAKHASLANQVKSFRQNTIAPLFVRYRIGNSINFSSVSQPSSPITTQPNGEITTTPMIEGNVAGPKGEASTSQRLGNENLKQEIAPPSEGNITGPKAEAGTSQGLVNGKLKQEITLLNEGNVASPKGKADSSQGLVNGKLKQEICMKRGSVVGLEEEADTIINFLTEESTELEVICITGMPGLGKTTLARKVYHSNRLRTHFPNVIWVDVSQKFEKRKVFLSILESLGQVDIPIMHDDVLATTIKFYLEYQKFLLIFDDVWSESDWEDIETALPKANSRGRVLITSRIESVANCRREPYKLGFLDENKSWDLLQLRVFDSLNSCPQDLVGLGKEIAARCGGVPLAIVVIAGVLLKKYSTSTRLTRIEWDKVSSGVHKYFFNDENRRTENLIALSYYELPLDLRYCFLYLGFFPEESPIPVRRLIRMWIAEGFIWRKPNMSLEDVAEENLKELMDRNLVMVDNVKPDGYIKTCRVHALIREFCKNEASVENHNLFQEMEMSARDGTFYPPVSQIENRRRICIHSDIEVFLGENPKGPRVHSLLCSAKEAVNSLSADTSPIPLHFNRLRVVDVSPIKLTEFPSKLTKLIHLRYIALSGGDGDDLWALRKAISSLWNLQSITIETNSRTFEIKANVWKMMHLRHLKTKAAIILRNKLEGPAGEQLQSLSRLSTKCCTKGVLNKAKNIHNLGICGDLNTILEVHCLRELLLLQKLKLVHDVYPTEASEKPLCRLPNPNLFPPKLRTLQLSGTFLTWNQIRALENLPALEELKLKNNAFMGKYWLAHDGCFASLEILLIADTNLEVWTAKDGYFPKLKCLILKDCKQLEQIPSKLKRNLEILHVENVSESAVESAKRIAEEKRKTQGQQSGGRGGFKLIITGP